MIIISCASHQQEVALTHPHTHRHTHTCTHCISTPAGGASLCRTADVHHTIENRNRNARTH